MALFPQGLPRGTAEEARSAASAGVCPWRTEPARAPLMLAWGTPWVRRGGPPRDDPATLSAPEGAIASGATAVAWRAWGTPGSHWELGGAGAWLGMPLLCQYLSRRSRGRQEEDDCDCGGLPPRSGAGGGVPLVDPWKDVRGPWAIGLGSDLATSAMCRVHTASATGTPAQGGSQREARRWRPKKRYRLPLGPLSPISAPAL